MMIDNLSIQKWDKDWVAIQIGFPHLKRLSKRRVISDKMQEKSTASYSLPLSRMNNFREYCSCTKLFTKQNRPMILCKSCYNTCCQGCVADLVRQHGGEQEIECPTCTMKNPISQRVPDQQTEMIIDIVKKREQYFNAKTKDQIQILKKTARKYGEDNKKYKIQNDRLSAEVDSSQKNYALLTLELEQKEKELQIFSQRMESKQSKYIELKEEKNNILGKYEKECKKYEEASEYIKKIQADFKELEKKYSTLEVQIKENERMVEELKEKLTIAEKQKEISEKQLTEVKEHYSNIEDYLEQKRKYHYKSFIDFAEKEFGQKLVIPPMKQIKENADYSQKNSKQNEKGNSSSEQSSIGALEGEVKSEEKSENEQQNVQKEKAPLCQNQQMLKNNMESSEIKINLEEKEDSNKLAKEPDNQVSKEKQSQVKENILKIEETKQSNEKEKQPMQYSKSSEEKSQERPKQIEKINQTFEKRVYNKECASKQGQNKQKKEVSKKPVKNSSFDTYNRSNKSQKPSIDPFISFDGKDYNMVQNSDSYHSEFDEYSEQNYPQGCNFSYYQPYYPNSEEYYYQQQKPPRHYENIQSSQQIPPPQPKIRRTNKIIDSPIEEFFPEQQLCYQQRKYDQIIENKRLELCKKQETFKTNKHSRKMFDEDQVAKYLKKISGPTLLEDFEYNLIIGIQKRKDEAAKKLQMLFQIKLLKDPQLFPLQIQLYACTLNSIQAIRLQRKSLNKIINLSGISQLKTLDLSQNNLRSIKELEGCVSVQNLYVNHNYLQNLKGIKNMKRLGLFSFNQNLVGSTGYQYLTKTICAKALQTLYFGSTKTFGHNDRFMSVLLSNNPLPNLTKIGILNQIFDNASKTVSNYNRKYRSDKKPLELFYLKQC